MPLSPGTRVGNYEILSKIGEGGMGEVYRGRDTRLKREVALKTLPDSLKRDPDRIARFEREAQTLAALNHPNIAIIHGVARGRAVDKRADIWAFGCVLYETLAGRPAFGGDNTTDILAAVVQQEPDWSLLPPDSPSAVTSVMRRCLQKNPRERLRDIGDARLELRSEPAAENPRPGLPPRSVRPVGVAAAAFVVGAAAAGLLFYAWLASRPSSTERAEQPVRVTVSPPPGVKLSTASRGSALALSPDGRRLVFVGQQDSGAPRLYVRELGRFEAVAIEETEGAANPFFSPDGASVGFFAGGRLKKVSLAGGAPVALAEVLNERGHAWLGDDSIVLTPASNVGLMRLPSAGTGRAETFTTLAEGELSHRWPFQLPDASAVLFSIWNDTGWDFARIAAQRAGSRERVVVLEAGGGYPRYLHDPAGGRGYLVYARAEGLLAAHPRDPELSRGAAAASALVVTFS